MLGRRSYPVLTRPGLRAPYNRPVPGEPAAHPHDLEQGPMTPNTPPPRLRPLPRLIFATRWLQLPLYLGLILAQCVYVVHFWIELVHLLQAALGDGHALQILVQSIGYHPPQGDPGAAATVTSLNETVIMLVVL